ncbi:hypothetical protein D3C71_1412490 [compost metagenome]
MFFVVQHLLHGGGDAVDDGFRLRDAAHRAAKLQQRLTGRIFPFLVQLQRQGAIRQNAPGLRVFKVVHAGGHDVEQRRQGGRRSARVAIQQAEILQVRIPIAHQDR